MKWDGVSAVFNIMCVLLREKEIIIKELDVE